MFNVYCVGFTDSTSTFLSFEGWSCGFGWAYTSASKHKGFSTVQVRINGLWFRSWAYCLAFEGDDVGLGFDVQGFRCKVPVRILEFMWSSGSASRVWNLCQA